MLLSITWLQYSITILIASSIYYIVFAILYYKNEISFLNFRKKPQQQKNQSYFVGDEPSKNPNSFFQNSGQDNNAKPCELLDEAEYSTASPQVSQPELFTASKNTSAITESDDTLQQVQELSARLKEVIAEGCNKSFIKEEFILSLQLLLKKYHFLKGTPFWANINNLIASECEKHGYISLSAEERVMLWNE